MLILPPLLFCSLSDAIEPLSRSSLLRGVVGVAASASVVRAGAAVSVIGQPRLPRLLGEHALIGCRYARVGGARVKIFYPAAPSSDAAPAPYCTDGRETSVQ